MGGNPANPSAPGIPRSHHSVRSRPFRCTKGAFSLTPVSSPGQVLALFHQGGGDALVGGNPAARLPRAYPAHIAGQV